MYITPRVQILGPEGASRMYSPTVVHVRTHDTQSHTCFSLHLIYFFAQKFKFTRISVKTTEKR